MNPSEWSAVDRARIVGALEEATGQPLAGADSLPDTLIVNAQTLGMAPHELRSWIYDSTARPDWQVASLIRFARRYGFERAIPPPGVQTKPSLKFDTPERGLRGEYRTGSGFSSG